ncbi:MAG: hypothetical protein M3Y65_09815 [Pseudomonadota bacterium]|nr:hypothetical protein [Pseudomonadota bacterium]
MSYLLRITNPNTNELVLSDQAQGLVCVGRATLISMVQPSVTGNPVNGQAHAVTGGYQVYRLTHSNSNPVLFAIDIYQQFCRITSVSNPSPGVWDVTVYAVGGQQFYYGVRYQVEVRVWGFSWFNELLDPRIGSIRRADGGIAYDFSRRNMLFPKGFGTAPVPSAQSTIAIPSLVNTVVLGTPAGYRNVTRFGIKRVYTERYINCWSGGNGQIRQSEECVFAQETGGIDEGQGDTDDSDFSPASFIVIEGQDLP